jgi:ATP-dependent Lhr-like helicase
MSANPRDAAATPSPRAQLLVDCIKEHGASFFDDLIDASGQLRSQLEEALAELVALGLVTSDSFGGLRALLVLSNERRPGFNGRRRRRKPAYSIDSAGRWALVRRPAAPERKEDAIEHIARALLARYGVVFWRLLEREAAWLPPWRELLRSFRRLESRGEIRGGRFVSGFPGEQFALPEAIGMLRATRRQPTADQWVSVSGADPLNLVGILTPGPRLPALAGNRLLYRDGIPTAVLIADDIRFLEFLDDAKEWTAQKELLRGPVQAPPISPVNHQEVRRRRTDEVIG